MEARRIDYDLNQWCKCGQYMEYPKDEEYTFIECPCCKSIIPLSGEYYLIDSDMIASKRTNKAKRIRLLMLLLLGISLMMDLWRSEIMLELFELIAEYLPIVGGVIATITGVALINKASLPKADIPKSMWIAANAVESKFGKRNGDFIMCEQEAIHFPEGIKKLIDKKPLPTVLYNKFCKF